MKESYTRNLVDYFATSPTPEDFHTFLEKEVVDSQGEEFDRKASIVYDYLVGIEDSRYMDVLFSFRPAILKAIVDADYSVRTWPRKGRNEYFVSLLRYYSMEELRPVIDEAIGFIIMAGAQEVFYLLMDEGYLTEDAKSLMLVHAIVLFNYRVVDYLLYLGVKVLPVHFIAAVRGRSISMLRRMIIHGGDVNLDDNGGDKPIVIAIKNGNGEMVREMFGCGANVNVTTGVNVHTGDDGESVLIIAIMKLRDISLVKDLVLMGADVNYRTQSGKTPLSVAEHQRDIIELLVSKGATDYGSPQQKDSAFAFHP